MNGKVGVEITSNACDQRNLTAKPGGTDRLIGSFSAEGNGRIKDAGRFTCLRNTVDTEGVVDIDTSGRRRFFWIGASEEGSMLSSCENAQEGVNKRDAEASSFFSHFWIRASQM